MLNRKTIVLVLRSGGDFSFRDVELISRHITGKWKSDIRPRIVCLYDKATSKYDLGNIEIIPLTNNQHGTWSRIQLYSPAMEEYRPFLYVDLDTAIINSLEKLFAVVTDESKFITLEDFWQQGKLATGLMWIPKDSDKVKKIWESYKGAAGSRMDNYIRGVIKEPDLYWQQITDGVVDFKPKRTSGIQSLPVSADVVCFHGKPRIYDAVHIPWVKIYVEAVFSPFKPRKTATVIIPYNKDRGWLKDAISSIPEGTQLLLSKGDGHWGQNFNKVLPQAEGNYIRWLHEDDMLTENSLNIAMEAIEEQGVDFIHGDAKELHMNSGITKVWKSPKPDVTLNDLLGRNTIHSATLLYKREVFETIGGFDESPKMFTLEEYEFNLRCLKAGMRLGYTPNPLAIYRRHNQQLIRTLNKTEKNMNRQELIKRYV